MRQTFLIVITALLFFVSCGTEDHGDTGDTGNTGDTGDTGDTGETDDVADSDDDDYADNTDTEDGDISESEETPDLPTFEDEDLLPPPSDSFLIQWGSGGRDFVQDVAVSDNGEIFITGAMVDDISGLHKIFLASFSAEGNLLWMHQMKSDHEYSFGNSIALDSQGNIFVAGKANGSVDDAQSENGDILLVKYSKDGTPEWIRQWGGASAYSEMANGVAVDSEDNIFVTGAMTPKGKGYLNVFLAKYTTDGIKVWIKQWGTDVDNYGEDIVIDDNDNIFVLGTWELEADVFLAKYTADGSEIWKKQWWTVGNSVFKSMALDNDGNIFITGDPMGVSTSLEKRDINGELLWRRGIPGSSTYVNNKGNSVAVDMSGNVFVTGWTAADLGDNINAGGYDAYLVKFSNDGKALWGKLWGAVMLESGNGVAVDSNGNVVVTGTTDGNLTDAPTVDGNMFLLSIKSQ